MFDWMEDLFRGIKYIFWIMVLTIIALVVAVIWLLVTR